VDSLISGLQSTALAHWMTDTSWTWPAAETLHFIGMSLLFGTIVVIDLRLLGLLRRLMPWRALHRLIPWAALGFAINLLTGVAFFVSDPSNYISNIAFRFKMLFVLLAGLNLVLYRLKVDKAIRSSADDAACSATARFVGGASLLAWTLVIFCGRFIPVFGPG
jgi:hypothetical protein